MSKFIARWSSFNDYPRIKSYDEFIGDRRVDMQAAEIAVVDTNDLKAIGYIRVTAGAFLGWPLVSSFCVEPEHRGSGAGFYLLKWLLDDPRYSRIYTSTEEGNKPMRHLLGKVGADEIGYADRLNLSGERELLYILKDARV